MPHKWHILEQHSHITHRVCIASLHCIYVIINTCLDYHLGHYDSHMHRETHTVVGSFARKGASNGAYGDNAFQTAAFYHRSVTQSLRPWNDCLVTSWHVIKTDRQMDIHTLHVTSHKLHLLTIAYNLYILIMYTAIKMSLVMVFTSSHSLPVSSGLQGQF